MDLWGHSWMRRTTHSLAPVDDPWHWGRLHRSALITAVEQGRIWVAPARGKVRGFAEVNEDESAFEVVLVVGSVEAIGSLLGSCRVLANQRGHRKCYLVLPQRPRAAAWARAIRFRAEDGGLLIYERTI
jgi:hypothetical protein